MAADLNVKVLAKSDTDEAGDPCLCRSNEECHRRVALSRLIRNNVMRRSHQATRIADTLTTRQIDYSADTTSSSGMPVLVVEVVVKGAIPVEWTIETMLARAFPGVPIKSKNKAGVSRGLPDTECAPSVTNGSG